MFNLEKGSHWNHNKEKAAKKELCNFYLHFIDFIEFIYIWDLNLHVCDMKLSIAGSGSQSLFLKDPSSYVFFFISFSAIYFQFTNCCIHITAFLTFILFQCTKYEEVHRKTLIVFFIRWIMLIYANTIRQCCAFRVPDPGCSKPCEDPNEKVRCSIKKKMLGRDIVLHFVHTVYLSLTALLKKSI